MVAVLWTFYSVGHGNHWISLAVSYEQPAEVVVRGKFGLCVHHSLEQSHLYPF